MKPGEADILHVSFTRLSALLRVRGQWTDAGRSAHSLAVDWQAWGNKGGLCWRATRDGLRHAPAVLQNHPTPVTGQDLYREANLNLRFPCGSPPLHALFSFGRAIAPYRGQKRGESPQSIEIGFCPLPHLPGPEKTRSSRAEFSREGFGVGFEVGVRTPDSHALVTRGNQSRKSDCREAECLFEIND